MEIDKKTAHGGKSVGFRAQYAQARVRVMGSYGRRGYRLRGGGRLVPDARRLSVADRLRRVGGKRAHDAHPALI